MNDHTHRADLYRRADNASRTPRGEKVRRWVCLHAGWPCNLQDTRSAARLERGAAGVSAIGERKLYLAPGSGARVDDCALVMGPGGPVRVRVSDMYELGDGWDDEAAVELTTETFVERVA